nr:reverse transcriptase domain-containing protein [Tanacetum cinerariifolium]
MLKALVSNKEKLLELTNTPLNENCSAIILKKLPEKLEDPGKFLIMCGFSELKCKALANLDLYPPHNVNPLSGSKTSSSPNHLLEEFTDKLALITFPPGNDDLLFDIESDLKEIEYLFNHDPIKDMDSILKNSADKDNLADLNDNLVDTMPEMFTDEHALDYSSPPLYDEYDDDLLKLSLTLNIDFFPFFEYDSFLFEDFSKVDALPLTNNEDKVFNMGILIQENLFEFITQVASDKNLKKLAISHASLILEDFDPPLYELPFFKEVLGPETLLSFSFENEKKVFKHGILTSKGGHSFLITELSNRGYKVFKIIKILKSPMEIFLFSHGEDIRILDVPCPHFYPP